MTNPLSDEQNRRIEVFGSPVILKDVVWKVIYERVLVCTLLFFFLLYYFCFTLALCASL